MEIREVFEVAQNTMLRTETSIIHDTDSRIVHGILGVADEAGELVKIVKAGLYYGEPLDITNLLEEMGDLFWYYSLLLNQAAVILQMTPEMVFENIVTMNKAKLKQRYPDKYSDELAQEKNRSRDKEIEAMQSVNNKKG